jgi:hypothetical protein
MVSKQQAVGRGIRARHQATIRIGGEQERAATCVADNRVSRPAVFLGGSQVNEAKFQSEVQRAETMRRLATDPMEAEYYAGFIRGLRRAYHGERFGTEAEHALWLALADSEDASRAAEGRGYRDGLKTEGNSDE